MNDEVVVVVKGGDLMEANAEEVDVEEQLQRSDPVVDGVLAGVVLTLLPRPSSLIGVTVGLLPVDDDPSSFELSLDIGSSETVGDATLLRKSMYATGGVMGVLNPSSPFKRHSGKAEMGVRALRAEGSSVGKVEVRGVLRWGSLGRVVVVVAMVKEEVLVADDGCLKRR